MRRILFLGLTLSACGGDDGDPTQPAQCDPASRNGTYLIEFTRVSGDCGDVPSQLVRVSSGYGEPGAGCQLIADDAWKEGNCRLERSSRCVVDGVTVETTGFTTQQTADGSLITGTVTERLTGGATCVGTYNVRYTRQ